MPPRSGATPGYAVLLRGEHGYTVLRWSKCKIFGIEESGDVLSAIGFGLATKPHSPKNNSRIQMQIQVGIVLLVVVDITFSIQRNLHLAGLIIAADVALKNGGVFKDIKRAGRSNIGVVLFDPASLTWD